MFQDMPQFMMIVIVLTFAFSQVFLLLITLVGSNVPVATTVMGSINAFWKMLFKNFKHVFGDGFEDEENKTKEHILLEFSSLIAALAITIVLVNMLIASMSETFNRVRASKTSEWVETFISFACASSLDSCFSGWSVIWDTAPLHHLQLFCTWNQTLKSNMQTVPCPLNPQFPYFKLIYTYIYIAAPVFVLKNWNLVADVSKGQDDYYDWIGYAAWRKNTG